MVIDLLASVKFAVGLIILIAAVCMAGTVLPQGADALAYAQRNPGAVERMALFGKLGLTHVFSAWWFLALLCALAATVMVCSTRRLVTVKRTTGFAQRRALGSMLTHISILLILTGAVVRAIWGEKGYVELRQGDSKAQFVTEKGSRPLPFAVELTKFEILTDSDQATAKQPPKKMESQLIIHWPERNLSARVPLQLDVTHSLTPAGEAPAKDNTFRIKILKYVPDFAIDTATKEVISRSSEPNNPAILVAVTGPNYENHRWVFARFPDFTAQEHGKQALKPSPLRFTYQVEAVEEVPPQATAPIRNFRSTLHVAEGANAVQARTVEVNRPLKYKGYTFYQTGYNPEDLSWTSLEVVHDPGVPLVYGGFVFLISGLFVVFYLNPWLASRKAHV